MLQNVGMILE